MEMLHIPGWYIVYTRPFREKKVAALFSQKNIEHYCPIQIVKPQYSGFLKTTYEPLFPSYVFVHVAPVEHPRIKSMHEVINLVHWLEKPAVIQNEEIDTIKKFLSLYTGVMLEKIPVRTNGTIFTTDSHLIEGKRMVPELINGFAKVRLPSLGYAIKSRVNWEFIQTPDSFLFDNNKQILSGKELK